MREYRRPSICQKIRRPRGILPGDSPTPNAIHHYKKKAAARTREPPRLVRDRITSRASGLPFRYKGYAAGPSISGRVRTPPTTIPSGPGPSRGFHRTFFADKATRREPSGRSPWANRAADRIPRLYPPSTRNEMESPRWSGPAHGCKEEAGTGNCANRDPRRTTAGQPFGDDPRVRPAALKLWTLDRLWKPRAGPDIVAGLGL